MKYNLAGDDIRELVRLRRISLGRVESCSKESLRCSPRGRQRRRVITCQFIALKR